MVKSSIYQFESLLLRQKKPWNRKAAPAQGQHKLYVQSTKDLSRLGRNHLYTGLYIEERFPMFGVRYIAINDNVDTDSAESNDLMPFKNLFNEWFVRDTSRKIRAVKKAKAERGEQLGTRAPTATGRMRTTEKRWSSTKKPPSSFAGSSQCAPPETPPARSPEF